MRSRNEYYVDVTTLSDQGLQSYVMGLHAKRAALTNPAATSARTMELPLSATEIVTLLLIATTEKNSRSAKEQTRASIDLSRETKALAEASLEQAKQSTKLSRETMELAKASHDLSQKMERLAKVAVGVALVSLVVAVAGIWQ